MVELVKEQVFLDQSVSKEEIQIMLEGDLIVPDVKPDMALLLQTEEKIVIGHTEAGTDRVNYMGHLNISVLYVAKEASKSVQSIQLSRGIDDFINLEGVNKNMWVRVKASIINIDYRVVNDRKVSYRAVIKLSVTAEHSDAHEMVVHINGIPESQLLKTNLSVNRTIEHRVDRFQIKDQVILPAAKPNLREILQATANITNRDVRLSTGRANLTGELNLTTLYRGDTEDSLIEFLESELPFNGSIDISGARENMPADVSLQILDQHITIRPDDDGEDRILEIEVSIGVEMKVYSTETLTVLEDAYGINQQLHFMKTVVRYPQLVCLNKNQTPVKEIVSIGENSPDMLQIFRVKGQIHLDEVRSMDDKIVAEGAITTDILYVAESDTTPLAAYRTIIPYRQVIEAKGTSLGMNVNIDASIDHVAFNMLSPRETEVRFQLTFNTQVVDEKETGIICDVEIKDIDPEALADQASITVYIVQPGDNLWKIAKKYNASLDELMAINELEGHGKVMPGQKLLMLKKGM